MSRKFFRRLLLIVTSLMLFLPCAALAQKEKKNEKNKQNEQKPTWRYVQTIYGGAKVYLADDVEILANRHLVVWHKGLLASSAFAVSKVEWDCQLKKSLTLEMTIYNAAQIALGTTRKFEWQSIIPGSLSDVIYQQICFEKPPPQFIEITADEAPLRSLPDDRAGVLRTAKKGSRFLLIANTGQGGWFNIVDEKTQQDYWIRGNVVKIIEPAAEVQKPVEKQLPQRVRKVNRKGNKRR